MILWSKRELAADGSAAEYSGSTAYDSLESKSKLGDAMVETLQST
jgi:hypothetical protein